MPEVRNSKSQANTLSEEGRRGQALFAHTRGSRFVHVLFFVAAGFLGAVFGASGGVDFRVSSTTVISLEQSGARASDAVAEHKDPAASDSPICRSSFQGFRCTVLSSYA
jgi:hypothetical protein